MTKKQLKEAYTNWNREITKLGERKREIFKELQEMCAEKGDGNRWCCIEKLVEELTKKGYVLPIILYSPRCGAAVDYKALVDEWLKM